MADGCWESVGLFALGCLIAGWPAVWILLANPAAKSWRLRAEQAEGRLIAMGAHDYEGAGGDCDVCGCPKHIPVHPAVVR